MPAAISDIERLAISRDAVSTAFTELLADLRADAAVISHEHLNRTQRTKLRAAVEAKKTGMLF